MSVTSGNNWRPSLDKCQQLLGGCLVLLAIIYVVLSVAMVAVPFSGSSFAKESATRTDSISSLTSREKIDRMQRLSTTIGDTQNGPWEDHEQAAMLLPNWLQEYSEFHARQRQKILQPTATLPRILLAECWGWNAVCGGTADRLRPLPLLLLVAHQSQRLLLIHWKRPAPLEEFLLPPHESGMIDWRVPRWLTSRLAQLRNQTTARHAATRVEKLVSWAMIQSNDTVVASRLQSHDHGATYYNQHRGPEEPLLRDVYRHIWNHVFTPVLPIAQRIKDELRVLHLQPGKYAAAHVRALYQEIDRTPHQLKLWTENAVNCASTLRPGGPIYFASDDPRATDMAIAYGNTKGTGVVVARHHHGRPIFHLDKTNSNLYSNPSDLYDTFVDLYLLGMSRCVAYNIGGYGKWGLLLGYNASCGIRHQTGHGFKKDNLTPCEWHYV